MTTKFIKSILPVFLVIVLLATILVGCGGEETTAPGGSTERPKPADYDTRTEIVFGQVTSLSGPAAVGVESTSGPIHKMWIELINRDGGLYIKDYGRKLPIRLLQYDDQSDIGTMTTLLEKLIVEDKVDFVLPPWSTAFHFAAAPIVTKYEKVLINAAGGALKLREIIDDVPYYFQVLNFSETQVPAMIGVLKELGVKSVAMIFIGDLHGIEYSGMAVPLLAQAGIEVKMVEEYPAETEDLSTQLKKAKALDVDAFIGYTYPPATFLATGQAIELGINFDVFFLNVITFSPAYRDAFGPLSEGMMGGGAWNPKSSEGAKKFFDMYQEFYDGAEPDYWGAYYYWPSLEHFRQAIEDAGTLDNRIVREYVATKTYNTLAGPFWYEDNFATLTVHPGEVGQWQNGIFEVVDPGEKRTAPPIIKPQWPGSK